MCVQTPCSPFAAARGWHGSIERLRYHRFDLLPSSIHCPPAALAFKGGDCRRDEVRPTDRPESSLCSKSPDRCHGGWGRVRGRVWGLVRRGRDLTVWHDFGKCKHSISTYLIYLKTRRLYFENLCGEILPKPLSLSLSE